MDEATRLRELKEFLRSRRGALPPEDVGLTPSGRRRSPGLRREELAWLAGVSASWYTQLEQGRPIQFSASALARIARALRLSAPDQTYFFSLTKVSQPKSATDESMVAVSASLQATLDALETAPAIVLNPILDVLRFNRLADQIFEFDSMEGPFASNHAWRMFRDPVRRALYDRDWEEIARLTVGVIRMRYAALAGRPKFERLFNELMTKSPEFAQMWETGHTAPLAEVPMRLRHHRYGEFQVSAVRFAVLPQADLMMSVLAPADPKAFALYHHLAHSPAASASGRGEAEGGCSEGR